MIKFNKKRFLACLLILSSTYSSVSIYANINDQYENRFNKKYVFVGLTLAALPVLWYLLVYNYKSKFKSNQLFAKINGKKMEINCKIPNTPTEKPTLVIVHAFGYAHADEKNNIYDSDFSKDYDILTNMLVEKGFKTVVISRLGYGKSDDSNSPRTNKNIAKEMSDSLRQLNINPPYILMGHSMGNLFCLEWVESHTNDILAYIGLDGTNPYYFESTKTCPELLKNDEKPEFLTDGIYGEWSYQSQNMCNLHKFKFPEKMSVRMFLSAGLLNNISDEEQGIKGWNSEKLKKANEKLFSNNSNQKIICLEDGDHFLYRSEKHAKMIVKEVEDISKISS